MRKKKNAQNPVPQNKDDKYFYFNVADESHAKLLEQSSKIDAMQVLGEELKIDEY